MFKAMREVLTTFLFHFVDCCKLYQLCGVWMSNVESSFR